MLFIVIARFPASLSLVIIVSEANMKWQAVAQCGGAIYMPSLPQL
jgi:hypothetical protein